MKGWEIGLWGGTSFYLGDLNTNFRFNHVNAAGGLQARYNFNNRLAMMLSGNYGMVEAYDRDSRNTFERARNLSFQSEIIDGTLQLEFNFLPYIHGSRENFFTPYLFGGLSVFYFNPEAVYDGPELALRGQLVELRPLGTEGQFKGEEYYTVTAALTYGAGFKFDLSYEWSVNIFVGARATYTDYLDDVSTIYPDVSDLQRSRGTVAVYMSDRSIDIDGVDTSQLGAEGQQRGDSSKRDSYIFAGVAFNYYFGDVRCPEVTRRN
jgi:hypothetical protein